MQQFTGRPAARERRGEDERRQFVATEKRESYSDRRMSGEPAKYNTRSIQRRIVWENDLYERQSI
ncbi:MAG: hypothetical protein JWR72_2400 [Flavisolibacter sp.]|jgi:hypothetical protein|nr:hypothetical protein [Flavisolibacter sp.]